MSLLFKHVIHRKDARCHYCSAQFIYRRRRLMVTGEIKQWLRIYRLNWLSSCKIYVQFRRLEWVINCPVLTTGAEPCSARVLPGDGWDVHDGLLRARDRAYGEVGRERGKGWGGGVWKSGVERKSVEVRCGPCGTYGTSSLYYIEWTLKEFRFSYFEGCIISFTSDYLAWLFTLIC